MVKNDQMSQFHVAQSIWPSFHRVQSKITVSGCEKYMMKIWDLQDNRGGREFEQEAGKVSQGRGHRARSSSGGEHARQQSQSTHRSMTREYVRVMWRTQIYRGWSRWIQHRWGQSKDGRGQWALMGKGAGAPLQGSPGSQRGCPQLRRLCAPGTACPPADPLLCHDPATFGSRTQKPSPNSVSYSA